MKHVDKTNLGGLKDISRWVYEEKQMRRGGLDKKAFRDRVIYYLEQEGWLVWEEVDGRVFKTYNVVAGDADRARIIFGAHYDTPARTPFPNFITPRNPFLTILYWLFICIAMFILCTVIGFIASLFGLPVQYALPVVLALFLVMLLLTIIGPSNPRNANDNTSGVITLLEIAAAIPKEKRAGIAIAFFDKEEFGMMGSAAFLRAHHGLNNATVINFDCVGEGDHLLFVQSRQCRKNEELQEALGDAFVPADGKKLLMDHVPLTLYPSDQMMFNRGIGVVALRKAKVLGLYLSRIHTGRDTVFDVRNINLLKKGSVRLLDLVDHTPVPVPGQEAIEEEEGDSPEMNEAQN